MRNTPAKRPRGRPPGITGPRLPPDQRKSATIRERVTPAQKAAYLARGGAEWLRAVLDRPA